MVDKIKELDTAIVIALMILCVTFLGFTDKYTEPVSLFFTGVSSFLLGYKVKR